jgi:hypothetical protein
MTPTAKVDSMLLELLEEQRQALETAEQITLASDYRTTENLIQETTSLLRKVIAATQRLRILLQHADQT